MFVASMYDDKENWFVYKLASLKIHLEQTWEALMMA